MSDTIEKINALLALMKENDIVELELEEGEFSVALRKQGAFVASGMAMPQMAPMSMPMPMQAPMPVAPMPQAQNAAAQNAPAQPDAAAGDPSLVPIKSPIVGTFYRTPSPEEPPFVREGDGVKKDAVICIIEAMKIMNEIRAETDGVIEKVLVESGEPVEYGQPLFLMRRA